MRVVFMGTPEFAVPTLAGLAAHGHDILAVYCRPPRPAGRGKRPRPCAVQFSASELGLRLRCPDRFSSQEQRHFADLNADVAVVVAYGLILPDAVLSAPDLGFVNVHPSLLPRWRGAAPVNRAIMAGDRLTGVSLMRIGHGIDTGPVFCRSEVPITACDTADTLGDRLAHRGAELLCEVLPGLATLTPVDQDDSVAVYASKISKSETRIDWTRPAPEVDRMIRGLSSSPGAWTQAGTERIRVLHSELVAGEAGGRAACPGTILDDRLAVRCGSGSVRLLSLQRSGRNVLGSKEFCRGFPVPKGLRLGLA